MASRGGRRAGVLHNLRPSGEKFKEGMVICMKG